MGETTLRVRERGRRIEIAFGRCCLGALPALYLLQAGLRNIVVIPLAAAGMAYALVWLFKALRMEFVAGPEGITVRDTSTTRTWAWSEVDALVDAFIPANQGRAQWALGIRTTDGSVVVAQMTACGKAQGRASTVHALRAIAWRYGVTAQLTGDATKSGSPTTAGWHPDPGGAPGERFWNGATWGPVRRYADPRVSGTLELWDPVGDATTALELYKTEARAQAKRRTWWLALTAVVVIVACVLWGSEDHKGGSFTFAAVAFGAAALCAVRTWRVWQALQVLERVVALAGSPGPALVGVPVGTPVEMPALATDGALGPAAPAIDPVAADGPVAWLPPPPVVAKKRDRMAVWSVICAIAGLLTGVAALVGIFFGVKARRRLRRSGGAQRDVDLATAGIVIGTATGLLFTGVVVAAQLSSTPGAPTDVAVANQALLRPSDYGAGWADQGAGSGTYEASYFNALRTTQAAQMASCLRMSTAHVDTHPTEVDGHEFAGSSGTLWATDTIDVFPTAAGAAADAGAAASAQGASCEQLFQSDYAGKFQADNYILATTPDIPASVARRRGVSALGAGEADLEASFPYKAGSRLGTLYIDMIFLRHGRVESNLWVVHENAQPALDVVDPLVAAAQHRLTGSGSVA